MVFKRLKQWWHNRNFSGKWHDLGSEVIDVPKGKYTVTVKYNGRDKTIIVTPQVKEEK